MPSADEDRESDSSSTRTISNGVGRTKQVVKKFMFCLYYVLAALFTLRWSGGRFKDFIQLIIVQQ